MHSYIQLFFRALLVTITIETMVIVLFFSLRNRMQLSGTLFARVVAAGVVASSFTLPFVWLVFPTLFDKRFFFLIIAELFAFVAEIPIIKSVVKSTWLEAVAVSLLANCVSFISGYLIGIS